MLDPSRIPAATPNRSAATFWRRPIGLEIYACVSSKAMHTPAMSSASINFGQRLQTATGSAATAE